MDGIEMPGNLGELFEAVDATDYDKEHLQSIMVEHFTGKTFTRFQLVVRIVATENVYLKKLGEPAASVVAPNVRIAMKEDYLPILVPDAATREELIRMLDNR